MAWKPRFLRGSVVSPWVKALGLANLLVAGLLLSPLAAQEPPRNPTIGGFAPLNPPLQEKEPRPWGGPKGTSAFIEAISSQNADAGIEVVLGRPRIITLKEPLGEGEQFAQISVGDPTIADVDVLSATQIRIRGSRAGVTDVVITTPANETYIIRIYVVYDLDVLRAQLKAMFPDAALRLGQIREHVVIEGEARDGGQVKRILETVRAYLLSMLSQMTTDVQSQTSQEEGEQAEEEPAAEEGDLPPGEERPAGSAAPQAASDLQTTAEIPEPQLINLIRVPGAQQVMLKVRVAELNRTALRAHGTQFSAGLGGGPNFFTNIIGDPLSPLGANTFITGVMDQGSISYTLTALRDHQLLKILAEPNLVALNGHAASFLAGGEFPYPVPQTSLGGGSTITIQFREFGVRLGFMPFILDNERVRLTVVPEVSSLDFTLAVVIDNFVVPALNTRRTETTVELKQGQTLAIAGLLQVTLQSQTRKIPVMGDLPYIGSLFSNNTNQRTEKELVVLITPYLIEPMNPDQVPYGPGDDVFEPNDLEFFLLGRIESKVGRDHRSTVKGDDPMDLVRILNLERRQVQGDCGFSD